MNFSGLNILYYDSKEINISNIIWGLLELGAEVERSTLRVTLNLPIDAEIEFIRKEIRRFNCVITQNFSVNVAISCFEEGVPYISWIYDSPQVSLYTDHAKYPTNFIFAFDKIQVRRLKECGIINVFHMPLAANIAYTSSINLTKEEKYKYSADISFVGQMYRLVYLQKYTENVSRDILDELYAIVEEKALNWRPGLNIYDTISDSLAKRITIKEGDFQYYNLIQDKFIKETMLIGPLIAQKEREEVLKLCGLLFKTNLFTSKNDYEYAKEILPSVGVNGPVDGDIPYKIYASSKLNLNLSLRTIESGVPQRVFDIMSMGGTVISNYQPEAEELFVPDKEIILFETLDELADKARFYLNHSSLRKKIGEAGYIKVKGKYNYTYALNAMFDVVIETIG